MKVTGIDATYYTVRDIDGLTRFYAELLGAPPDTSWEGRLSEWIFADGTSFGLYAPGGEHAHVPNGSAMFAVDDVAQAVDEAKARGVHFHDDGEITDTPACHMAFGEDTEKNQFILHHRKTT